MPLIVTITAEPSGSVVARGGDSLAVILLDRAGFPYINDWHGPRHRLPTSMSRDEQAAIASHAAEMLRAARYTVEIDPQLDIRPAAAGRTPSLAVQLLEMTDQIRGAGSGADLADTLDSLLHPEHGVLERVREALEAAGEQITDIDDEAYQLADRFGFAGDFLIAAQSELAGAQEELRRVAPGPQDEPSAHRVHDVSSAARATSPHAVLGATGKRSVSSLSSPATPPPAMPGRGPAAPAR
jgi:hypothetical protein